MTSAPSTRIRAAVKPAVKRQRHVAISQRAVLPPEKQPRRPIFGQDPRIPQDTLEHYVSDFRNAPTLTRIEAERAGVSGGLVKEMAKSMGLTNLRMFEVIGVPKATAEKRAASKTAVDGVPGHAALGLVRLLGIAKGMAEHSDAAEAANFDSAKWLGEWIERPQPALGGRKPAEMLDTPTGVATVCKLLGAIESGVYL